MASLQEEFEAKCVQLNDCSAKYKDAENELKIVRRGELAAKREEVQLVKVTLTTWKRHADKREREKKDTIESLKAERKQLHKDQEEKRKAMTLANKMLEGKYLGEKRDLAASQVLLTKLQSQFEILQEDRDEIAVKLDIEGDRVEELCCIRHMDQRYFYVYFSPIIDVTG
jgi:hypothetical protein